MHELPTGTVTLLFSDIERSTHLLQQLGDLYVLAQSECRRLLREAFHCLAIKFCWPRDDSMIVPK